MSFISQSGGITFNSITDMYFIQTGLTNVIKFVPGRYFNVSTTWADFSVSSIGNSLPAQPLRFQDSEGVSFNNTFLFNGGTDPQALDCGVTGALILNDNVVINGNLTIRGSLYYSDNYQNCMAVPTTAPSDARVKHNVREADSAALYERVTRKMPIKSFLYTDEFLKTPGRASHLKNTTYYGVIAQDIVKDFEYAITKGRAKLGSIHLPDMHHIHPELLYGEIVGALQHARKLHEDLSERLEQVEAHLTRTSRMATEGLKSAAERLQEAGRQARDSGQTVVHSAEDKIHKALGFLHARLERLERAVAN